MAPRKKSLSKVVTADVETAASDVVNGTINDPLAEMVMDDADAFSLNYDADPGSLAEVVPAATGQRRKVQHRVKKARAQQTKSHEVGVDAPVSERLQSLAVTAHKLPSQFLDREVDYKRYGNQGIPVVAFPTSEAHYTQWEDFGMIDALADYIEAGDIQVWTVDTFDNETFFPPADSFLSRGDAAANYEKYMNFLHEEFFPELLEVTGQAPLLTGCSMGGYHSGNYFLRYPEKMAGVIALSGIYSLHHFLGDNDLPLARANAALEFLNDELTPEKRRAYRRAYMVFCSGQGDGEADMLADTEALYDVMHDQDIPGWVDIWGESATHDWPWWVDQLKMHLDHYLAPSQPPLLTIYEG